MIKLAIAITSFGNRSPERYGQFYKTTLPGRDRPAHVFRRATGDYFYDESTLAEFNKDLEKMTRDARYLDHGVTVVAFVAPDVTPPEPPVETEKEPPPVEETPTDVEETAPEASSDLPAEDPANSTGELPDEAPSDAPAVTPPSAPAQKAPSLKKKK